MTLEPFVDPLPLTRTLQPKERFKCFTYYEVTMKEFLHNFHSNLPNTRVWGYEGEIPGPTIEVTQGECVHIKWINDLPDRHLLPIDHTIHGSGEDMPNVRTVVHLHGAEVEPESDGHPEAWFSRDFAQCGPRFAHTVYKYSNNQKPATLWYHDHALGITRLNVYAGLAGMYIIRNEQEDSLGLPSGKYEIPLIIQDKSFNEDGSLFYPRTVDNPPSEFPNPSIIPGFVGDFIVVNGKIWPYLEVEQRKYRFRILNASNQRFYRMRLDSGQPFVQIGSDGGLLQRPVTVDEITIAPAERVDVIIDFSEQPVGSNIILTNRFNESEAKRTRDITLDVTQDRYGRLMFMLNDHMYIDKITENPMLGDIEIWRIINSGIAVHPIHIHLVQFQILDRIPFDVEAYNLKGQIRFTGDPEPPLPGEQGWKDTVQAFPGFVTRVIMRFAPYIGRYVYHCHILEHEDYDMMRQFEVIPRRLTLCGNDKCLECSQSCRCICE
ncbi:MAG: spore coat protein manganese oxidase [Epulopiscium sp.]|jgi:spore coat protein A|nr:multicopper oxidase family protein [Defluviitaleaceae bacterium]MDK2788061.1 spore coat protein manganese oxidase [Candidatus Epulonipiscium sp.]